MSTASQNAANAKQAAQTTATRILEDLSVSNAELGTRMPSKAVAAARKAKPAEESAAAKQARELIERMQNAAAAVDEAAPVYLGPNCVAQREGEFIVIRILASESAILLAPATKGGEGKNKMVATTQGIKNAFGLKIGVNVLAGK